MNERVKKLLARTKVDQYPVCTEKAVLVMNSFVKSEGEPEILRRAKATAHYLDNRTIFIEDDELLVGNIASKPMGMEAGSRGPTWLEEDLEDISKQGVILSDGDKAVLKSMDSYWKEKGRTIHERQGLLYDDNRLWPFIQSGILCPPWKQKKEGRGPGFAGGGWGLGLGAQLLAIMDFSKILDRGLNSVIKEAKDEFQTLRFFSADEIKKAQFLQAVIIVHEALIRVANRFHELAIKMTSKEMSASRKTELIRIAEACSWVPGNPARNFREAMQSFWFVFLMIADGTTPGGRFDQFMYPFYKKDKDAGIITDEQVMELLECLRIKLIQFNSIGGGKMQRAKWAGMARWHNFVIGGVTPEGKDASNELSYLVLEAAKDCQVPQYTITVRVHDNTPESLMIKALEVVRTGIGMPAFVGDKSYIEYITSQDVALEDARDYALAGCLDVNIAGKSRICAVGMFICPLVFEITMNNGIEPRTGKQLGLKTGNFESFNTFDDFMNAFKKQLAYFMGLAAEEHNILLQAQTEMYPEAFYSSLMVDAIKVGKDACNRILPFENGSALNLVGMINVADSMAAMKKLVFDDKKVSKQDLKAALASNWNGYENIRKLCLAAPKYGNGDNYVDLIAKDLYQFWSDTAYTFPTAWGGTTKPTGISITAHAPGGALTGATPDGRYAGENLADGTMSAAQGKDTQGPIALLRSAMTINQIPFQATLLNMKFHPSALKTTDDLKKLSSLIKTYFSMGGKHVQFNVVSKETLVDGQNHPDKHRDLIVRVAGYSAYFVTLGKPVQDDIIARTEHSL